MPLDDRILDLLLRYEELLAQGQHVTPEELCHACPELAAEVRVRIEALQALHPLCSTPEKVGGSIPTCNMPVWDGLIGPLPCISGYKVQSVLGRGGMGVVYKARHLALRRLVALKMILASANTSTKDLARFRAEAEAIARLQHPNIVQIYEIGEADSQPFFALEYVSGGSLAAKLAGTPQPPLAAAQLVGTLAAAVHAAHRAGIIHRDLKPANVLLTEEGVPKLTDFGIAKQLESDAAHTQTGAIVGTPSYMAPEQAAGQAHLAGPAADVYALGAILYECLTGRPPFKAATMLETLDQVRSLDAVPPRQLQPTVPRDVETICLKCLRKEPLKRYANADALAEDLRRFQAGEPIVARPVGRMERSWRWCRRNPGLATAVSLALTALTALIVVGSLAWKGAVRETEATRERLRDSIIEQARSERRGGNRWLALELLKDAAEMERSSELRAEAILAIALPGMRPHREVMRARPSGELLVFSEGLSNSDELSRVFPEASWEERAPVQIPTQLNLPNEFKPWLSCASQDGSLLAFLVGGWDAQLWVWDVATARFISCMNVQGTIPRHHATEPSFSPDSTLLAITFPGVTKRELRIWDVQTGAQITSVAGVPAGGEMFRWSRDGRWMALIGPTVTGAPTFNITTSITLGWDKLTYEESDQYASLWEIANSCPRYLLRKPIKELSFRPDGSSLTVDDTVWQVRQRTDSILLGRDSFNDGGHFRSLSFAGADQIWATEAPVGKFDGMVGTFRQLRPLERRIALPNTPYLDRDYDPEGRWITKRQTRTAAFSPDGKHALLHSNIYAQRKSRVAQYIGEQVGLAFAFCPYNPLTVLPLLRPRGLTVDIPITGSNLIGESLELWDLEKGKELARWSIQSCLASFQFSPDGRHAVIAGNDPSDPAHQPMDISGGMRRIIDITGKGEHAYVPHIPFKGIQIREVPTGRIERTLTDLPTDRATFSPNGTRILALAKENRAALFDIATGRELTTWRINKSTWLSAAQSPDGSYIVSGDEDGTLHLWDTTTGDEKSHWQAHDAGVTALTFHPEGHTLVSGGADGVLRLWNLPLIRKELAELGLDW